MNGLFILICYFRIRHIRIISLSNVKKQVAQQILLFNLVQKLEHVLVLRQSRIKLLVLLGLIVCLLCIVIQVSEHRLRLVCLLELLADC